MGAGLTNAGFYSQALTFPNITFSGEGSTRVVLYGTQWYYEWMLTSSGILNFPSSTTIDITLIGGGGKGGNGAGSSSSCYIGSGGGAGTPVYLSNQSCSGSVAVVIGDSQQDSTITISGTTTTAAKGGNGVNATTSSSASTHGTGFLGSYLAYGNVSYVLGTTGNPATRNGTPGAVVLGLTVGLSNANIGDALNFCGRGPGAGGGGGSASAIYYNGTADNGGPYNIPYNGYANIAYSGMEGARGVCLIRCPMN